MKEEKVGLTPIELALSIAGIVFLLCLIVLPPVFRVAFKEEKKEEDIPTQAKIKKMTCTKSNYYEEDVKTNSTYVIMHYKDRVRTYSVKIEKTFNDPAPYDTVKQDVGKLATAYGLVEGINYNVNPSDQDLKIITEEDCDLAVFKSTSVSLPGEENEIKINSLYSTKDSVEQIKIDLEHEGYSCK